MRDAAFRTKQWWGKLAGQLQTARQLPRPAHPNVSAVSVHYDCSEVAQVEVVKATWRPGACSAVNRPDLAQAMPSHHSQPQLIFKWLARIHFETT